MERQPPRQMSAIDDLRMHNLAFSDAARTHQESFLPLPVQTVSDKDVRTLLLAHRSMMYFMYSISTMQ